MAAEKGKKSASSLKSKKRVPKKTVSMRTKI